MLQTCCEVHVIKTLWSCYTSANKKIVALKEIRLQEEEGAPFTAIREGIYAEVYQRH